jgi:hypothetical protein
MINEENEKVDFTISCFKIIPRHWRLDRIRFGIIIASIGKSSSTNFEIRSFETRYADACDYFALRHV